LEHRFGVTPSPTVSASPTDHPTALATPPQPSSTFQAANDVGIITDDAVGPNRPPTGDTNELVLCQAASDLGESEDTPPYNNHPSGLLTLQIPAPIDLDAADLPFDTSTESLGVSTEAAGNVGIVNPSLPQHAAVDVAPGQTPSSFTSPQLPNIPSPTQPAQAVVFTLQNPL
jgi:hypothetical protein